MNKKEKIEKVKKLATPPKKLTPEEMDIVNAHRKKSAIVCRNPTTEQCKLLDSIESKGYKVIIINRKIVGHDS